MLNSHCNNNDKKKCGHRDSNPVYMDSKSTVVSTTLWRQMKLIDKNNQYILYPISIYPKVVNREKIRLFPPAFMRTNL